MNLMLGVFGFRQNFSEKKMLAYLNNILQLELIEIENNYRDIHLRPNHKIFKILGKEILL